MTITRRLFLKLFAITGLALFTNRLYAMHVECKAPTNVRDLYSAMCEVLPVGVPTIIKWSVTGEEYTEYTLGIYTDEAARRGIDPEAHLCLWMWRAFLAQVAKLDEPERTKLYWRIKPEIAFFDDEVPTSSGFDFDSLHRHPAHKARPKARIYLRYLVSSKPMLILDGNHENDEKVNMIRRSYG